MSQDPVPIDIGMPETDKPKTIVLTGEMEIVITQTKAEKVGRCSKYNLFYYKGRFRSGTNEGGWIEASVLAYDNDNAAILHNQCTKFHHPYVMRSLGYGKGVGAYSNYTFIALPAFSSTFGECVKQSSDATVNGRFSEPFIEIVSQTVKGIKALHDNGFHCPNLQGKHIAIKKENGCSTVQIWSFRASDSDTEKAQNWPCLASLLLEAARNNGGGATGSTEIHDLCNKMQSGKLKGLDILKHSALLTVQQKFDNVIALNIHVLSDCKPPPENPTEESSTVVAQTQTSANSAQSSTASTERYCLDESLDKRLTETTTWPSFIKRKGPLKTFRDLLHGLRCVIEHEDEYIPPELTKEKTSGPRQDGTKAIDLEQHFRNTWPRNFLKIQVWAVNPRAKFLL